MNVSLSVTHPEGVPTRQVGRSRSAVNGRAAGNAGRKQSLYPSHRRVRKTSGESDTATINGTEGDDSLSGGANDDPISGGGRTDSIEGGAGDDALFGGRGDDRLDGGAGNDRLEGGGGDDSLDGGDGADTLIGGFGDDTIVAGEGDDYVDGGAGADLIDFGGGAEDGADTIAFHPGTGHDTVTGFDPDEDAISVPSGPTVDDLVFQATDDPAIWLVTYAGGDPDDSLTIDTAGSPGAPHTRAEMRAAVTNEDDTPPPEAMRMACFTPGCRVMTTDGPVRIERLRPWVRIVTRDDPALPLLSLLRTRLTSDQIADDPALRPVVLRAGSIAPGVPARRMRVLPQHGILADLSGGERLIRARHLVERLGVGHRQSAPRRSVDYLHVPLPRHALILVDGMRTESFLPHDAPSHCCGDVSAQDRRAPGPTRPISRTRRDLATPGGVVAHRPRGGDAAGGGAGVTGTPALGGVASA